MILSAELVHHYKPDPETYLMVPHLLDLRPEVMMVAAHVGDLRAVQAHDLQAAYVPRPLEWALGNEPEPTDPFFDTVADDFIELANS